MKNTNEPKTVEGFRNLILDHIVKHRNQHPQSKLSHISCEDIWKPYGRTGPMINNREQIEVFHESIRKLEREGVLNAVWDPATKVFTKVCVAKEQADLVFQMRHVMSKTEYYDVLQEALAKETVFSSCQPLVALAEGNASRFVRDNFRYKNGTKEELDADMDAMRKIIRIVTAVWENGEDVLERNLSIRMNLGSKGFAAHYKQKVVRVLAPNAIVDGISANDILKEYHVLQNPPAVGVRGNAVIHMKNGDRLTLSRYNAAFYWEEDFVAQIDRITTESLYSVENLTTFNSLPFEANGLVVFTSGYPCLLVTNLMDKVIRDNSLVEVFHCGDMDAYGFKILRDIDSKLSAKVHSCHMGIDDYLAHKEQSVPMTEGNRRELSKMLHDQYYSENEQKLFRLLLNEGVTLEQESLST